MDIKSYMDGFNQVMDAFMSDDKNVNLLEESIALIKGTDTQGKKIFLIGNGGSSAIAEHMAIDFTKNAKLKAMAISGSPMLTTFANDYGFDQVYSKAIEAFADQGDLLIAISSGGTSINIINAVKAAKEKGLKVITFSGFEATNSLSSTGDINIWVDSYAYGYVELIHNLLIHYMNDKIIGSVVYKFR